MKQTLKYFSISICLIILICCKKSNEHIYADLEKFDNSLDSLVTEITQNKPDYLIFQSDTLKNNVKSIEEICFQIIENDSIKIDANCHIYKFYKNQLIINSSENILGGRFVQKYVYFADKIDNKLLDNLRNKKSDTIYIGYLKKYNSKGNLVKFVESNLWNETNKDGSIVTNENRLLEVYRYNNGNSVTTWRKEYFNKQYNIDSLRNTKIKEFTSNRYNAWDSDRNNYSYKTDKYGNWKVKKNNKIENPDIYYRKNLY